ncbi:hypothetical protein QF046_000685 [Microbacterium sp. W4I4]|uniref:DNA polymerase III subunit gamma/tau n=1 Tax=Microbacterium sp. W4I4 TaxID=3042295 RepID=UPI002787CA92|nr:DNA polymerase III subunit gamma/tau [Microbacterium sp. W4I4]MDQ0613044.1 hypothetical protein [Microbacterium sp. W4I4]
MKSEGDDDALSWDGDDALDARRPEVSRPKPEPTASAAPVPPLNESPSASVTPSVSEADADDEPQGISTATLLMIGILGGIYLLYTVGWILGGVGMQLPVTFTLPVPLYQGALWLAVLAPALWFVAVLAATRGSRSWVRIVWLVAGAVLLVPWPFVVSGGGGAL